MRHLSLRLLSLLAVPPVLWAGNAVVGRLVVDSIGPMWLNVARWLVAFAILLPLGRRAVAGRAAWRRIMDRWPYLAVLGLLGVGTYNALQYLALRTSTPVNVTLIASSLPVWSMILGALFYGTHPNRMQVGGAALSLAGVATVLSRGDVQALRQIRLVEGDLLMLAAIVGWALYSWMLVRPPAHMRGAARPDWTWAEFLVAQCIFGIGWTFVGAGLGEWLIPPVPTRWSWGLGAAILFVAVGPSVVAYRSWGLAVAEAGPGMAAIFYNLTPLLAALMSAAVIGEGPQLYHGIAFGLIVAGILLSSFGMPRLPHADGPGRGRPVRRPTKK